MEVEEKKSPPAKKTPPTRKGPRWQISEIGRSPPGLDGLGGIVGAGLWSMREPFKYTRHELSLEQGHKDRVRTADCMHIDQRSRRRFREDSQEPSDWKDRTSLSHEEWRDKLHRETDKFRDELYMLEKRKSRRK